MIFQSLEKPWGPKKSFGQLKKISCLCRETYLLFFQFSGLTGDISWDPRHLGLGFIVKCPHQWGQRWPASELFLLPVARRWLRSLFFLLLSQVWHTSWSCPDPHASWFLESPWISIQLCFWLASIWPGESLDGQGQWPDLPWGSSLPAAADGLKGVPHLQKLGPWAL